MSNLAKSSDNWVSMHLVRLAVGLSILVIGAGFCVYYKYVGEPLQPNAWGDFLAGFTAILAVIWLVCGFYLQREELKQNTGALNRQNESLNLQKDELKLQREELQLQREEMKLQRQAIEEQSEATERMANHAETASWALQDMALQIQKHLLSTKEYETLKVKPKLFIQGGQGRPLRSLNLRNVGQGPAIDISVSTAGVTFHRFEKRGDNVVGRIDLEKPGTPLRIIIKCKDIHEYSYAYSFEFDGVTAKVLPTIIVE